MDDIIFYESTEMAGWKLEKYQKMYDTYLEEIKAKLIEYIHDNNYGEIDIKNKTINISYIDGRKSNEQ